MLALLVKARWPLVVLLGIALVAEVVARVVSGHGVGVPDVLLALTSGVLGAIGVRRPDDVHASRELEAVLQRTLTSVRAALDAEDGVEETDDVSG